MYDGQSICKPEPSSSWPWPLGWWALSPHGVIACPAFWRCPFPGHHSSISLPPPGLGSSVHPELLKVASLLPIFLEFPLIFLFNLRFIIINIFKDVILFCVFGYFAYMFVCAPSGALEPRKNCPVPQVRGYRWLLVVVCVLWNRTSSLEE